MKNRFVRIGASVSALLLGSLAIGHVWFVQQGVHFKSPAVDFGVPPPQFGLRYSDLGNDSGERAGTTYFASSWWGSEDPQATEKHREALLRRGLTYEAKGQFSHALSVWRTAFHRGLTDPGNLSERLILLKLLVHHPDLRGGREILAALPVENKPKPMPAIGSVAPSLKPFVAYANAFRLAPDQAAHAFLTLAATYPRSPITESALISAPRVILSNENPFPTAGQFRLASLGVDRLMQRFPHTRFRFDVVGARGRIQYLKKNFISAMHLYRRQLTLATNDAQTGNAIDSIMLCAKSLRRPADRLVGDLLRLNRVTQIKARWEAVSRLGENLSGLSRADATEFGHQVRTDPELLAAYVDYRINFTSPSKDLFLLAKAPALRAASPRIRSHILSQLAAAATDLDANSIARSLAQRALSAGATGNDQARAMFVKATILNRTGKPLQALAIYREILASHPKSYLADGVKENLALLYERRNQLGKALDLYRQLKYDQDVAFMIDARMSSDQLAAYVETHPNDQQHKLLLLSLGFRYLRDHRYAIANATFHRLTKRQRIKLLNDTDFRERLEENLPDPAIAAVQLGKLEARRQRAKGVQQKAAALYALAEYYYNHRNLLLYNAALWKGERQYVFQFSWNANVARPEDQRALDQHHWSHECFAQTLLLCRQIISKYPNSRVAARAAYTGAVSAQHLSIFSGYWRWVDARHDLAAESVKLMHRAEKSSNPWLAARAHKYASVFAADVKQRNADEYRAKPTKQYLSGD